MQAPLTIDVAAIDTMTKAWADAVHAWFAATLPQAGGTLRFDLQLLSTLTGTPHPLIRLDGLSLAVANVVNPGLLLGEPSAELRAKLADGPVRLFTPFLSM